MTVRLKSCAQIQSPQHSEDDGTRGLEYLTYKECRYNTCENNDGEVIKIKETSESSFSIDSRSISSTLLPH